MPPLKLAVLISGTGTTLQNLMDEIAEERLNCKICLVVGSRPGLKGIARAQAAQLPVVIIDRRDFENQSEFSEQVFAAIDLASVDLVCLAGWLCLLQIPSRYDGRVMNIHPALLPRFGGKGMFGQKVHQAVLDAKSTLSGCTVHYVDNLYDNGPIILQRTCPVFASDTSASLAARVFEEEKIAYPDAIRLHQAKVIRFGKAEKQPAIDIAPAWPNDSRMTAPTSIADIRKDYQLLELSESDVLPDPIEQFTKWFSDANAAEVAEPTGMTLATADISGKPSARIVLLKAVDARGFAFFTNKSSYKGHQLQGNPRACLVFWWQELERQVRIEGSVEHVDRAEAEKYFHSRPVASQVATWASDQSTVIPSRAELSQRQQEFSEKFAGKVIAMPDHWGGYRVVPSQIEFWQGRRSRLHDRLRYSLTKGGWKIERLAP